MPLRTSFLSIASLCLAAAPCIGCHSSSPASPAAPAARASATPSPTQHPASTPATPSRSLYVLPEAGLNWLYTLVNGAQQSIDLTMYELVDTTFSADLVSACQRGVRVRVLLDQSLEKTSNTPAYTQLNTAGPNCSAAWSNLQFQATHQKSLVIDGKQAIVMTFNLTSRFYAQTRDLAIAETDPADLAAIEATFNTDYGSSTDFNYQPAAGDDLLWSPTTAQAGLLGLIAGAKKTLLVENEEMGSATIVQALEKACRRGVKIEIAMTDTNPAYHANYTALERAGCGVHIGADDPSTLYVHAKTMVADIGTAAQAGYVGSINFSDASLTRNRELGLTLHDPALLGQIGSTVAGDYTQFPAYP